MGLVLSQVTPQWPPHWSFLLLESGSLGANLERTLLFSATSFLPHCAMVNLTVHAGGKEACPRRGAEMITSTHLSAPLSSASVFYIIIIFCFNWDWSLN